jgi:hypothetical protein
VPRKCHRLSAVGRTAHGLRRPWTEERCQVWPMSRPPVHWQAHLKKQVRKQGVVRLYGALWCRFGSTTGKRAGRRSGATAKR